MNPPQNTAATLQVLSSGLFTTVQDLGRVGYQHMGVPRSGALDLTSLRLANLLVGNLQADAGLEFLRKGPELEVCADSARIAICSRGSCVVEVDGEIVRVPMWRSLRLVRGQIVRISALKESSCGYIAVEGGFDLPPVLGSLSTYARALLGGFGGRSLSVGAAIPLRLGSVANRTELHLPNPPVIDGSEPVRLVAGPQDDYFTAAAFETLFGQVYTVSREADRMGMRLDGPRLEHRPGQTEIVSDGLATGCIQVPGSGRPIVLLADCHTAGGYPKIATVISSDLCRISSLLPGAAVRFQRVDADEAEEIRRSRERTLCTLETSIMPYQSPGHIDVTRLLFENLISGVTADGDDIPLGGASACRP